jgi:hypothetical protein
MDSRSEDNDNGEVRRAVYDCFMPHLFDCYRNGLPIENGRLLSGLVMAGLYDKQEMTGNEIYKQLKSLETKGVVKLSKSFQNNMKKFLRKTGGIVKSRKNENGETYRLSNEAREHIGAFGRSPYLEYGEVFDVALRTWRAHPEEDGDAWNATLALP